MKEFGEMYMRIRTDLTDRSREEHERTIRFLREHLGDQRPLQRVTPLDARGFIASYRKRKVKGKPVSPATVNKVMRECRRFFREAVDCQFINATPFAGMRPAKVAEMPWHHVTPTEFHALLNASTSSRWQGIIAVTYCCGLRLSETLHLTWADVDFEARTVRVVAKRGQDADDWAPKDKDMRIVPLPTPACVPLTKLRFARGEEHAYVFTIKTGPNAGNRIPRRNTWRYFDVIRQRAGLPPCSIHDLRRSYFTNLSRWMPMHVVQELAGHSDIRTTRRFYIKVQPALMDEARRVLEDALAS